MPSVPRELRPLLGHLQAPSPATALGHVPVQTMLAHPVIFHITRSGRAGLARSGRIRLDEIGYAGNDVL
ncbi:hypothetical protein Skr01_24700 [Sphaerisporangium krabiense]|nr:hypothetical protein Skr01_24700 [Sphaerisporangium krabiense]